VARPQAPGASGEPARESARARIAAPATTDVEVMAMAEADWPAVARIYAAGIAGGDATFERLVPSWERWSAAHVSEPRLVARQRAAPEGEQAAGGEVLGWAALGRASSRAVYRGVGEVSIYVDPAHARRGVGGGLLRALVERSEREGFWTLTAGIFPENAASIALHERCGFELVGVRRRIGQMADGRWRDVALYERRSRAVATD
jgi:L-amino acid N-acyltransferase YncA